MRLICPNCDAEYEVDDAAIPSSGRDVQCSGCGHAWFQTHPQREAEVEEEEALFGASDADDLTSDQVENDLAEAGLEGAGPAKSGPAKSGPAKSGFEEPRAGQPGREEPQPADVTEAPAPEPEEVLAAFEAEHPASDPAEPPAPEPLRRSIDESVLAVLREEAEREAAARRGERPRIETQTEMTLPETPRPAAPRAAAAPVTRPAIAAEPALDPVVPARREAPRKRAMLPAIEEIKSSLNPTLDPEEAARAALPAPARGGFGSGLVLVVLAAVVLLAIYVMAPLIAETVPALREPVAAYVATVNDLRVGLDTQLQSVIGWLHGLAGGSAG